MLSTEYVRDCARLMLSCLELTELSVSAQEADIVALCNRAQGLFPGSATALLPPVASICIEPQWAKLARQQLPDTIAVAGIVNFPSGDIPLNQVFAQIQQLRAAQAQEVDFVFPYLRFLAGDQEACRQRLAAVRQASSGLLLKVTLESGVWVDELLIAQASKMCLEAGADFLKTSTGQTPQGATFSAASVMLGSISRYAASGSQPGFVPSHGLRTFSDAQAYMVLVKERLGIDAWHPKRLRIGASSLWANLAQYLGVEHHWIQGAMVHASQTY